MLSGLLPEIAVRDVVMWDRLYRDATWNGVPFNILKTDGDEGKRIDAQSLPYVDAPTINVMGDSIPSIKIDAVFVGNDSLVKANEFISELRNEPVGVLEHPYLGELRLVYQKSSFSFSTEKGKVSLRIEFLRQGKPVPLPKVSSKSLSSYTEPVLFFGAQEFEEQIKRANVSEVSLVQDDYDAMISDVDYLASQIQTSDLDDLYNQINDAKNLVSSIAADPLLFVNNVSDMLQTFTNAMEKIQPESTQATSLHITAEKTLKNRERSAFTSMLKLQTTTTQLHLNRELALVANSEDSSLITVNIDHAYRSINQIKNTLNDRIEESTATADHKKLPLSNALIVLKDEVSKQLIKVNNYKNNTVTTQTFSPTPSMVLSYDHELPLSEFEKINTTGHPLFISGDVVVKK